MRCVGNKCIVFEGMLPSGGVSAETLLVKYIEVRLLSWRRSPQSETLDSSFAVTR